MMIDFEPFRIFQLSLSALRFYYARYSLNEFSYSVEVRDSYILDLASQMKNSPKLKIHNFKLFLNISILGFCQIKADVFDHDNSKDLTFSYKKVTNSKG
jgi:hypothetical protein